MTKLVPGTYVLARDVKNPHLNRTHRRDWRFAEKPQQPGTDVYLLQRRGLPRTMTRNVPDNPPDGTVITEYELARDSVSELRYTYIKDKPCHEVVRYCEKGTGVPYRNEWYCERRWIDDNGPSAWSGAGRIGHEAFQKEEVSSGTWDNFADARNALLIRVRDEIEYHNRRIERLTALAAYLKTAEAP